MQEENNTLPRAILSFATKGVGACHGPKQNMHFTDNYFIIKLFTTTLLI
jgi:hypothetical protein